MNKPGLVIVIVDHNFGPWGFNWLRSIGCLFFGLLESLMSGMEFQQSQMLGAIDQVEVLDWPKIQHSKLVVLGWGSLLSFNKHFSKLEVWCGDTTEFTQLLCFIVNITNRAIIPQWILRWRTCNFRWPAYCVGSIGEVQSYSRWPPSTLVTTVDSWHLAAPKNGCLMYTWFIRALHKYWYQQNGVYGIVTLCAPPIQDTTFLVGHVWTFWLPWCIQTSSPSPLPS